MKKITLIFMTMILFCGLCACGTDNTAKTDSEEKITVTDATGKSYDIPKNVTKIVGATPAATEIIAGLGEGEKLVAIDNYSIDIPDIPKDLPTFDTMAPDMEKLLALEPQVLIASTNSLLSDKDPFKTLKDHGVTVIYMDNSVSLEGIMKDVIFVSEIVGNPEKGKEMANSIQEKMDEIAAIGSTIEDKKSVYFEISPSPDITSFGTGNFLNEILSLVGATNIFGDKEGWLTPNAETIIAKNPDVILTNVNYMGDQISEIKIRDGWDSINAIKNNQVLMVDANATSRPTQNIVKAMDEIAKAIYPDMYK